MGILSRFFGSKPPLIAVEEEDLVKAKPEPKPEPPKGYHLAPWDIYQTDETTQVHKGTVFGLDFLTLNRLSRVVVIGAIIQTRCNQVGSFARRARDKYDIGFNIALRDNKTGRDLTAKEQAEIEEICNLIETCGPEEWADSDFDSTLKKIVRDSYTYDQAVIEPIRSATGKTIAFSAIDAATIRRSKLTPEEVAEGRRAASSGFVQVIDGVIRARWDRKDLGFMIRRPRSDIKARGYGYPEIEELLQTLNYFVSAFQNNGEKYVHGIHAAGILALKTKMSPEMFRAFSHQFSAKLRGSQNSNKTMLIQLDPESKEEIQSVNLAENNHDSQFDQWLGFLMKLVCSLYQIDPAELGFVFGAEGQTGALSQGGPGERVKYSKDKGLRPLLCSLEALINKTILWSYEPWKKYVFSFAGLDTSDPGQALESDIKKLSNFMTVNEIRKLNGMEPLEDPAADRGPMNQNFIQMMGSAAEPEPDQGEGGEEDQDPDQVAEQILKSRSSKVRVREVEVDV